MLGLWIDGVVVVDLVVEVVREEEPVLVPVPPELEPDWLPLEV
jgi:hypothetical protein